MAESISVLIAEDEAILSMYLEMILKRSGFLVVGSVSTGEEAVAVALETKPDAVLMDVRLAGSMDGVDAAQQISSSVCSAIVFMTGYSNEEIRQRAEGIHPFAYLVKPFEKTELLDTLSRIRGRQLQNAK